MEIGIRYIGGTVEMQWRRNGDLEMVRWLMVDG
jgi:hypothetical protein